MIYSIQRTNSYSLNIGINSSTLKSKEIEYICINKLGKVNNIHGSAGFVRNIGMSLVKTPWIGFLDDDDKLLPNYVESLIKELKINLFFKKYLIKKNFFSLLYFF